MVTDSNLKNQLQLKDRAREWVNENYPDLEGEAWERKVEQVMDELAELDGGAESADDMEIARDQIDQIIQMNQERRARAESEMETVKANIGGFMKDAKKAAWEAR